VQVSAFEAVLRRVDPELAVVVVSYGREPFVAACRRRGVPVAELQHGVLSDYHLGYAYSGDRTKRTFPDYFLSWGPFWNDAADLPLPDDRVFHVGYPWIEARADPTGAATSARADPDGPPASDGTAGVDGPTVADRRVVFVSQGPVGAALSKAAVETAESAPALDVVYKLHPGEYSRWQRDYPWLADAPLAVVDGSGPGLYELFAGADTQVGAFSTALFEGLYFGLDTYVLDLPGSSYMDRLVAEGVAVRVDTAAALVDALAGGSSGPAASDGRSPDPVDIDRFFRPDALANVADALAAIRRRER